MFHPRGESGYSKSRALLFKKMQDTMDAADVILKMRKNESPATQAAGNQQISFVSNEGDWLDIPKFLEQENCDRDTVSNAMQQIMAMQAGYLNDGNIYQQYCCLRKTLSEKYPGKKWIPPEDKMTPEKIKRAFREGKDKFLMYENLIKSLSHELKAKGLPLSSLWDRFVFEISERERMKKSRNRCEPMLLCVCVCVLKICV